MNNVSSVLAKLHEIGTALSRPMVGRPLGEVFDDISTKLLDLFDADHSTITLLDEGRRFFRIEAEYPHLPTQLVGERIPVQGRATQLGLVTRQEPVVVDDLNDHVLMSESLSFRQVAQALDIRSLLIVPMVTAGNTIGTISIDTVGRTKRFSKDEVDLCQTVANQMASFVAIARLRDEQQKYRRQAALIAPGATRTSVSARATRVARTLFGNLEKVIQFKKASLQLIVEGRRILVGTFGFEMSHSHPWLLRPVGADPLIRDIVQTQRPKILPDTALDKYWEKQEGTFDVHSWIGMPLVFQGEVIGILTLDHDRAGFYANISEDVLRRLDELAIQAAHDLWDAYSLEVAQRQVQALEIVRQFAETVATKLDPNDVLMTVVKVISTGLECTRCSVFLAGPPEESESLVRKAVCQGASCKIVTEPALSNPQCGPLPCPVRHAFQSGDSTFISDREHESRFDFAHEMYQDARSMIAAPLKTAEQVIGVVLAVHDRPGWFSGAEQLLLETLARQAASAIERDYGLELVHSIGNKILGDTEVDAVLKDVVSGAMKLTHTDSGVIYELNEDCTEVFRSFKPEGSIHPRPRLKDPRGITRTVISTKKLLEIRNIDEKDSHVNPDLRGRYRSMFAIPLLVDESVVGVLYLNCKSNRELTETERSLLGTLAGQAALAIQRTRLDEQIKDSDAMYRSLVDHIPQYVFRKDRNSRFTWANASFCQSLGKSLEEIKGKSDFDFYPKVDAEKYILDDLRVMESRLKSEFCEKHRPPGGKPKIRVQVVKTPVLDSNGEVTGVQAIFWDITSEVQEREMAQRWQSLAEQSPDGIVVLREGKITLANPAAVRLFGASSAIELEGRSILGFVDESARPLAKKRLMKLDNGEGVKPMVEMRVLRSPDEKVDVEVYTRRVPETGETQVVFHDLTRTKGLLREMHHRVRRSLNQVDGFLTRQEQSTEDRGFLHAFAALRERIQAMALVHEVLYRTEKESDVDMELYLRKLRVALLRAHGSFEPVAVDFSARGVILSEKLATACGLIATELVSNSLLHAFPQGSSPGQQAQVSVSLRADGDMLRLVVTDNGIGMRPMPEQKGDSMGLSLVRSLVLHHLKGQLTISSEPGTCFTVEFPRI